MATPLKILLLAGEESGLVYARRLEESLRRAAAAPVECRSYQSEGFKTADLAVMGFWPVLKRLFFFLGVARRMKRVIRAWRPDAVVTVDYPGLNLKLAAYAKARGIPAVHLVCPQVWAWHRSRIPRVAAAVTKLLCFFPFEPALFDGVAAPGFSATFIGHLMVDVFAAEGAPLLPSRNLVALLPGSRLGEIDRNLPPLLAAVDALAAICDFAVEIPAANDRAEREIRRLVAARPSAKVDVRVTTGGARALLRRARCAAVASGTATLEAALARCPTVLVYAVSPLLAWFARRVIKGVKHIGLANVIWEKCDARGAPPMPELLQEDFTSAAVAAHLRAWLTDDAAHAAAVAALDRAMTLLHSDGDALGVAARETLAAVAAAREEGHA